MSDGIERNRADIFQEQGHFLRPHPVKLYVSEMQKIPDVYVFLFILNQEAVLVRP